MRTVLICFVVFMLVLSSTSWDTYQKEPELTKRYVILIAGGETIKVEIEKNWNEYSKSSQDSIKVYWEAELAEQHRSADSLQLN